MDTVYCGLDVGSSTCHLVGIDGEGEVVVDMMVPTSQTSLVAAVQAVPGEAHVHLEATDLAGSVRRIVKAHVARVVVGHPTTNAWIAKDSHKNDRRDAHKLARLLRMGEVHEVYYPDDERRAVFRQVVQHYDDLAVQQARVKNKIKARLRAQGVIARGSRVYGEAGRGEVLAEVASPAARTMIEQLYGVLDETLAQREAAKELMAREARRYPEVARFGKVPGVGIVGACRFSAYVQNPHRFSSKRKLWRYCCLAITDRRSDGKRLGRQRLDRSGNRRLKDMSHKAFQAAMRCRDDNLFKRSYRQALERTRNETHARLTTQRKILAVLRAMWINGTEYQEAAG